MRSPLFGPSFYKLQSCGRFCCAGREGWCWATQPRGTEHWPRTAQVTPSRPLVLGPELGKRRLGWRILVFSASRTSWVSEPAQRPGMKQSGRIGARKSRAPGRQSCCSVTLDWLKLWTSAEAETRVMFWHIKHRSWVIFCCFCGSQKMTTDFWFLLFSE